MRLFDTHCHINMPDAFPDVAATLAEATAAGVDRVAVVGIEPDSCRRALEIADQYEGAFAILGHHPNQAATFSSPWLGELESMLAHPKAVALGEIGLDYHWEYATPAQQFASLEAQFDLALRIDKPVVFHVREAYDDFVAWFVKQPRRPRCLCHCFGGNADHARQLADLDVWIGVDGPLTYKKSADLRAIMHSYPRNRVVIETDAPYLSPEPFRGKPNSPARVALVNQALAECWGVSAEESANLTTSNAEAFFGL